MPGDSKERPRFEELHRAKIEKNLDLVFSRRWDGKISVAQQIFTDLAGGRRFSSWAKNALITDIHGIEEALNGFQTCLDILLEQENAKSKAKSS
jgi:hypothetical protein